MSETWPVDNALIDQSALTAWMDERGYASGAAIGDAVLIEGGTQNVLLRFRKGEREFVLRRPPPHKRANSDKTMVREARVLAALAGSDVPHPGYIDSESDLGVLGAAFYLMEPIDGFGVQSGLPEPHRSDASMRHDMGLSMADAIAALARVDHVAAGLEDFGKPNYLERQVPRWQAQLDSYSEFEGYTGPDIPGVAKVAEWLEAGRPADDHVGIIHGDFHLNNVMFRHDAGQLAAVVDWELATIGDPLIDLGQLLALWPDADGQGSSLGPQPWEGFATGPELVARYGEGSDRDLSNIDWYTVLACYRLGIILEGTNARADAGKAPREVGDMLHDTTVGLFNRALSIIG
jgi:aminoglycoside phosphotransferase (APT) family kinase protein